MRQKLYNVLEYIVIDYKVNVSSPCAALGLQFALVFCTKKWTTIIIFVFSFCIVQFQILLYQNLHKLGERLWTQSIRSFFTIAYFTPIWRSVRKKPLNLGQISLVKIFTIQTSCYWCKPKPCHIQFLRRSKGILFSIPRHAPSDSRCKHKSKSIPVWVTKNDTQWQAAIAHRVYVPATALLSEGKLANEYT
jgi:hypothetical protein